MSSLSRWLDKLQPSEGLVLGGAAVVVGLAGGVAAAFNAPIAGVFFALEIILGELSVGAFGTVVGLLAERSLPALAVDPPAFAMVGMAAVLAGAVHAPLTATILLFEMTNDYRIILPLMFAVGISLAISRWLQRESVYGQGLVRKGIRLERGRDVEVLEGITVAEVMQTDAPTLLESDSLAAASDALLRRRFHGLPVLNLSGELVGVITVQDIDRAQGAAATVGELCTRELLVAQPDETIGAALRRMSVRDIGRLPVVAADAPRRLLGVAPGYADGGGRER